MTGPIFLTCCINTLVRSVLLWSNKCNNNNNAEITPFIPILAGWNLHISQTPSHQRQDMWPTNCIPKDAHASVFFYTSGTSHTRHIHGLFELWGRPFRSSLLASFFLFSFLPSFLLVLLWKEFIPYSFVVTFHFSCLSISPPVFHPAGDGCWIRVNISCSACIYSLLKYKKSNNFSPPPSLSLSLYIYIYNCCCCYTIEFQLLWIVNWVFFLFLSCQHPDNLFQQSNQAVRRSSR